MARQIPPQGLEEQLALLDQVLALEPRHSDAHDLRATLLAEAGRYPEALAACAPSAFAGSPPCELLGRRAWVLACSGRRTEAVAAMKAVLELHPDYEWGTRMLADWTAEHGTAAEAVDAAERLVRVAPDSAFSYTARGAARLRASDPEGGAADLEHALALDPTHAEAGARLFDSLLARTRLDEADRLLARLQPHLTEEQRACRAVRVLAARGDRKGAVAGLAGARRGRPRGSARPGTPRRPPGVRRVGAARGRLGFARALHPDAAGVLVDVLLQRGGPRTRRDCSSRGVAPRGRGSHLPLLAGRVERAAGGSGRRGAAAPAGAFRPQALALAARAHACDPPAERLRFYEEILRHDSDPRRGTRPAALLLTQLQRHAEARAACRKTGAETEAPSALRARAA